MMVLIRSGTGRIFFIVQSPLEKEVKKWYASLQI